MITIKVQPGTPRTMDTNDRPTFDEWMARVGKIISRYAGLDWQDLPDMDFATWYAGRMRPVWAAKKAIRKSGGGGREE